jgi:hypothetical protein
VPKLIEIGAAVSEKKLKMFKCLKKIKLLIRWYSTIKRNIKTGHLTQGWICAFSATKI